MTTRGLVAVALAAFCCAWLASPAWAAKGDTSIRFGLLHSSPTDDLSEPGETISAEAATGFQVSVEYMVTDKIGVEPGLSFANHDVEVEPAGLPEISFGDIDYRALTADVNFHVGQSEKLDVYLGPTIGYVFWGDLKTDFFGPAEEFGADSEFVYGANVGLNVPFGEGTWAFAGSLSYLFTEVNLEGGTEGLGVDPLIVKVGVSYKF